MKIIKLFFYLIGFVFLVSGCSKETVDKQPAYYIKFKWNNEWIELPKGKQLITGASASVDRVNNTIGLVAMEGADHFQAFIYSDAVQGKTYEIYSTTVTHTSPEVLINFIYGMVGFSSSAIATATKQKTGYLTITKLSNTEIEGVFEATLANNAGYIKLEQGSFKLPLR